MGRRYAPWRRFSCLAALLLVAGCTTVTVWGLRPEYPDLRKGFFSGEHEFVEVDSLRPTLRWEAFPRPEDHKADREGLLRRIGNVTYDLKIWRTESDYPIDVIYYQHGLPKPWHDHPGEVVYSRQGLPEPWHEIEHLLEPSTKYFWTIRARFDLDGQSRVTEWALSQCPCPRGNLWAPIPPLRRWAHVPNPNYYRFKTPAE